MDFVTLEDVLDRALPGNEVEVPEWGGKVEVRAITSSELDRVQRLATARSGELNGAKANVIMTILGCVEPRFALVHLDKLMRQPPGPFVRISSAIMELSGMEGEEEEDLGEA